MSLCLCPPVMKDSFTARSATVWNQFYSMFLKSEYSRYDTHKEFQHSSLSVLDFSYWQFSVNANSLASFFAFRKVRADRHWTGLRWLSHTDSSFCSLPSDSLLCSSIPCITYTVVADSWTDTRVFSIQTLRSYPPPPTREPIVASGFNCR
jgi:hypothetical protein